MLALRRSYKEVSKLADIDIVARCKEYSVEVDASDVPGTLTRLINAMQEKKESAETAGAEATDKAERLMGSLEKALGAINQRAELHEAAGVQGKQALGVDPGGAAAIAEEAGHDPERTKQVLDSVVHAKAFPIDEALVPLRHPIYDRKPEDGNTKALQEFSDTLYIMSRVLNRPVSSLRTFKSAVERSPAFRDLLNKIPDVRFRDDDDDSRQKSATDALVSDSTAAGGAFTPRGLSATVWEDIRVKCLLMQQFQTIQMPTRVFDNPYRTGSARCYLTSQATDMTPHAFDTQVATLTAKGFGAAMEFSGELDEDSLTPVMPIVVDDLSTTLAESLESAILNGDVTDSTHMDTCVTAATDVRKAWDGLRYLTYTASLTQSLATFTIENLRKLTAGMGKYGTNPNDLVWVVSPKARVKLLSLKDANNYPMVQTVSQIPNPTVVSGMLNALDGSPIIVSGQMPENLTTAGIYGDTGGDPSAYHNTTILQFNKRAFLLGERRGLRIENDRFILGDFILVVAKARWAWVPKIACSASYKCAYAGIAVDVS